MSRMKEVFENLKQRNKKALIPFITAGFPHPDTTLSLMQALVEGGADCIELGIPFSDPMADGPTIQRASEVALEHKVGLKDVLAMVAEFRKTNSQTPIVLMGYANPIERMGVEQFVSQAHQVGVDGVLVVDYPPEECQVFTQALREKSMDTIFLLAPTSTQARIEQVAQLASGYVYYVSLKGVTGSSAINVQEVQTRIQHLKQSITCPIAVGFGIRDAASAKAAGQYADGVVMGSRIIEECENLVKQHGGMANQAQWQDLLQPAVKQLLLSVRHALDTVA